MGNEEDSAVRTAAAFRSDNVPQGRNRPLQEFLIGFSFRRTAVPSVGDPGLIGLRIAFFHLFPGKPLPETEIHFLQPGMDEAGEPKPLRDDLGRFPRPLHAAGIDDARTVFGKEQAFRKLQGLAASVFIQVCVRASLDPSLQIPVCFPVSCEKKFHFSSFLAGYLISLS